MLPDHSLSEAFEEHLRETEQKLDMAIRQAGIILFTQDLELRYTWARNSMHKASEIIGGTDEDLWLADDAAKLISIKKRVLESHEPVDCELRLRDRQGGDRWVALTLQPLYDAEGTTSGIIGSATDITQRINERQQLRVAADEQAVVAEIGREALDRTDIRDLFAHAVRRVREVLSVDRVVMLRPGDTEPLEPVAVDGCYEVLDSNAAVLAFASGEAVVIDDAAVDARVTAEPPRACCRSSAAVPMQAAGGKARYGVLAAYSAAPYAFRESDVAFLRSVGNVLASAISRVAADEQLRSAERLGSLGHLAASMAHEFNNVLMGIGPFVEVLRKSTPKTASADAAFTHITSAIARGKRITGEVRRFVNPGEPSFHIVDVRELIDKEVQSLRNVMPSAIALLARMPPRAIHIRADTAQIEQVLTNLILNARDAMRDRAGEIVVAAALTRAGTHVDITVHDNGPGIPAPILDHIFDPFFTTKPTGTGLGLAVARQMITAHGGEIRVENDEGATFHIVLPCVSAEEADAPPPARPQAIHVRKVLVVEDDPSVASGLKALLDLLEIESTVATTAAEALDVLDAVDPDVVLLDVGLPDRDGRELYRDIAVRRPAMPVIFSTGHADRVLLEEILRSPNVRCLTKPYSLEALEQALADLTA